MNARETRDGRIELVCDQCGVVAESKLYKRGGTRVRVRAHEGWKVAEFSDRFDYCPECEGGAA